MFMVQAIIHFCVKMSAHIFRYATSGSYNFLRTHTNVVADKIITNIEREAAYIQKFQLGKMTIVEGEIIMADTFFQNWHFKMFTFLVFLPFSLPLPATAVGVDPLTLG
jgi:hypothetical protein